MVRFTGSVPTRCSNVSSVVIHTATKLFVYFRFCNGSIQTALHTRVIIYLDIKAALRVFIQTVCMCMSTCALMWWITCPPHMRSTHYGSTIHHFTRPFTDLYGIYVGNVSVLCAKVVLLSRCRANVSQNAETMAPVWFVVVQHVVARRLPLDGERRGSNMSALSVCMCR